MITDEDEMGGTLAGVLAGAADVDWYSYSGTDVSLADVDPTRTFSGGLARVCKFARCINGGATDVICSGGATAATSPTGASGCCDTNTFDMEIDCPGTSDDDATVYVRVDQPTSDCVGYSIGYHY
jgi:hypothetical protein